MSSAFNFVSAVAGAENRALVSAGLVAAAIAVAGFGARLALKRNKTPLVPDQRFTLRNLLEFLASFVIWLGDSAMGRENRKYLPFGMSVFVYVFSLNLLGLLPGFVMPTDEFQFNLGMALSVFVLYNYWGIRAVGLGNYLKHLWGPPFKNLLDPIFLVGFLMFPIELISNCFRPVTLSLRLFGNMTGDHLALAISTDLTKVFSLPFYMLGTIVCLVQASVFTLLTMIYIRLAVAHGDSH